MSSKLKRIAGNRTIRTVIVGLVILLVIGGYVFWQYYSSRVYVEKAELRAPIISLNPPVPGVLKKVYVKEGDFVGKGKVVAVIGNQKLKTGTSGYIISVKNSIGSYVLPQEAVVTMYNPKELEVVGRVKENKGLSSIKPGQKVMFKVDAFGSKKYYAIVDRIVPSPVQSVIAFSISNKREEKEFEVIARFNDDFYPELRNGMSAKMWIYK